MGDASRHAHDLTGGAFVGAVVTAPTLALLLGVGADDDLTGLVHVSGLVAYSLVLGASVLSYFHWRMQAGHGSVGIQDRLAQWLTVGLTAGAVNGLLQVALADPGDGGWLVVGDVVVVLALCACASVAERADVPGEPALVCTAVAVAIPAAYSLVQVSTPAVELGRTEATLLSGCVVAAGLLLAWIVLHRVQVSLWARRRLALAAVLMCAAQGLESAGGDHPVLLAGSVVGHLTGAAVLCAMTLQLLRGSVQQRQAELEGLQQSLADVRAAVVRERELLHEVGATLAGISSASRVMRLEQGVPHHRRQRLESMLNAELGRLERLMQQRVQGSEHRDQPMWLDDVVEPVVTSHLARGRRVAWRPCGATAVGDADELAELCNILLENAARHGGGSVVTLTVTADGEGDGVEVVCSDRGPGVPLAVRDRIFDVEVKGERSSGQGLGLAIAHRLATDRGGDLRLLDDDVPGATFVATLPAREVADQHAGHVA